MNASGWLNKDKMHPPDQAHPHKALSQDRITTKVPWHKTLGTQCKCDEDANMWKNCVDIDTFSRTYYSGFETTGIESAITTNKHMNMQWQLLSSKQAILTWNRWQSRTDQDYPPYIDNCVSAQRKGKIAFGDVLVRTTPQDSTNPSACQNPPAHRRVKTTTNTLQVQDPAILQLMHNTHYHTSRYWCEQMTTDPTTVQNFTFI